MIIYTSTGNTLLDIPVSDESYRYRAIRQGAKVYLYFSLAEHVEVPVGSYVEYEGQRYTLWRPEDFKKHGTRNFEYSLTMGDDSEWLNRVKYKHLSAIPLRLKFPLTGSPRLFLQLLIDNLNEADGGWTLGTCIEGPDRALSFNHEYCGEVLDRFADEWGTEYEFEGKTLNFGKVEYNKDAPLPLSYGKGNGFKTGVGRQNQGDRAPVTILYVQGGERNIDASTYGSSTLLLPKSQELEYEGRRYKTDADGLYITRADRELTRRSEDSLDASDIYPSRVGTVSEVIAVDAANHLYDIKDSSIPDSLDYSQCRIAGERATLIFQSGVLAGEEFDIEQTDEELTGYVHAERRFKLVPVEKEGGVIPNENRKPSVGDTYAVFNISLPAAYVCDNASKSGASWDMFREGVRCLYEKEEETFTFSGELDGIWAKSQWLTVGGKTRPGGYVLFSDPQFQPEGIAIRITGVKDYINRPHSPEIELSNTPVAGFLSSDINKIDSNEVKDEQRYTKALQFTKRRYRDAIEAQEMLEAAFDNYSKGIDPIWVRTMSLLVGDESLQFRFVSSRTNPQTVEPDFRYNDETGIFTAPALILQHLTLGIKDIKREHESSEYQYWDLEAYTSPYLGDYGKLYFYARCGKTTGKGQFLMSEEPHKMEEGDNYYFLVGLLGSQFDGIRSFVTVYGFTEILPGRITVDRIVSTDGQTYFVLDKGDGTGEIHGRIILTAGSSGLKELAEWDEVQREIEAAQATADEAVREIEETSQVLDDFQTTVNTTFKDEVIETSEAKAIEKYINLLKAEKVDADAAYSELSANPFLPTASASDLSAKKSAYDNAHTALIKAVQDAIADKRTDEEEKAAVDSAFTLYNTALSNYRTSVEAANEAIQNALKGYSDAALAEAKAAHSAANAAQDSADEAGQAVEDLGTEIKTTFRDGVLTEAEKISIEKYLNTVESTMADVRATYTKLYANPYLEGTAETGLKSAYDNLTSAYNALVDSIEAATADDAATDAEFADVNTKFDMFNSRLNSFKTAIEAANEAIQNALKGYSDAALAEAKAAHSAANAAQDSADEAGQAVEDLGTEIKTTFRDGVLTEAEKISIEKYLNTVESTMADVRATYTKLYANPYLEGTAETGLKSAYDNLTSAYNALVDSIEAATADDAATDAEFADVNTKFDMFNSRLNSFKTAIEAANEAIQNALKGYSDAALAEAKAAHSAANAAQDSADEAGQAVEDLGTEIKTTFRDGVLTDAEKISIEKYLNTVESTMADVRATYTKLYANPYLEGTAETGLKSAYDNLTSAYNALVDSIELATDDDTATDAEFADVNTKFDTFNSRLNSFKTAIEAANEAIQTKLKELSDDADEQIRLTYDSKIENLGSQISASVTALNEFKEEVRSAGWITTAEGNQLWARKDGIISAINQSPESITISASRINLNGKVTFSMFNNSLQNIINGKADTSDLGNLATLDTVGESQLSSSVKNTINGKLDDSDVGALAYLDKVEAAQLGTTIISGGHIITSLIDTDAIFADMASIGGFTITGSMLYSNNYDSYVGNYRLYMNSSKGEIGIDNSTRVTYRLGGNYEYASGEAATFYIRRSMATTRMAPVVGAIKIKTFDNAGSDVNAAIDVEIEDGNGGSFMQFLRGGLSMRFTAKQFSNDTTGILRTCIWAGRMPTHTQVSTLSGTSTRYTVKWDSGTGLMYVE